MPVGQFTGSRSQYVYTNDAGGKYVLTLDDTLAALSNTLTVFDPTAPAGAAPPPKRFKPRGVFWQGTGTGFVGKRKYIVCGTSADTLYATAASQSLTVDGATGKLTGRKGEKLTF